MAMSILRAQSHKCKRFGHLVRASFKIGNNTLSGRATGGTRLHMCMSTLVLLTVIISYCGLKSNSMDSSKN